MIGYPQGRIDYTSLGQIRMVPELPKLMYANEENGPVPISINTWTLSAAHSGVSRTLDLAACRIRNGRTVEMAAAG